MKVPPGTSTIRLKFPIWPQPMPRSLLLNLASRAKAQGSIDFLVRYNPLLRWRVREAMRLFRNATVQERATLTAANIARIQHLARRTRYGAAQAEQFSDWPILEKQTVLAAANEFVAPWPLVRIPASTGGTTGVPLKLWRSLESIAAEQLFIDDLLAPYGVSMRSRMAVLRADNVKAPDDTSPPYGRIGHFGKRLTLSSPHLNARTLPWYHQALQHFAPAVLWVYPSVALNLLSLLERADLRLSIPVILASSEVLPPAAHAALQHRFGATVINYYGQAERVCFAQSVRPEEFFFNPSYGRVELVPLSSERANTKGTARIVGTPYWNAVMPLIRYDTGDLLEVPHHYGESEQAEITLGLRPFTGIIGRQGEYVLTADGMRIIGLNHIPREVEHILQIQLVQPDHNTVLVHVLAAPGFSTREAQRLRDQARAKLPASMRIEVKVVDCLRTTALGKTPFVIRLFS
jgi:phenylacetate-CoA ligase